MARKADDQRLEEMFEAVRRNPGEKPGFIARLLGWERSEVTRRLPALEERGLFLSEDERGGLWPFKRRQS